MIGKSKASIISALQNLLKLHHTYGADAVSRSPGLVAAKEALEQDLKVLDIEIANLKNRMYVQYRDSDSLGVWDCMTPL